MDLAKSRLDSSSPDQEGSSLEFMIQAVNACVTRTNEPQAYVAYIDIVDYTTQITLDTREVTVVIPPHE